MKLGLVVHTDRSLPDLLAQAAAAESLGIDLVWLEGNGSGQTSISCAAALAPHTSALRFATCVDAGGHPLSIVEAAAVADNCSNGRLILVVADVHRDRELLAETVDVIVAAAAPRPFEHAGARWQIPARLPQNDQHEQRIVITPPIVQVELPVWLTGSLAAEVARVRGLSYVSAVDEEPTAATACWSETAATLGLAERRLRRPAIRALSVDPAGSFDVDQIVNRLHREQLAWGLDTAILQLPPTLGLAAWRRTAETIATQVRPRVMMHELPPGLEAYWNRAG
jgi:alkanesulfonate monooxygenase SsuD/methylene tetrahydromethanopterin reductase-like flavin-dependent oxidoreductase (luciferase family)